MSVKRAPVRFGGVNGNVGRDGNAGFNIRGLEGNRVLLTIDGIRVPRELTSGVFGPAAFGRDYYDIGLISRVEILRGANSALYGSDGLAGMVAMFTTEPKNLLKPGQTLGGRVGLSYDGQDQTRRIGATLAGAPSDTVQWLGSVQVGRSEALGNQGTQRRAQQQPHRTQSAKGQEHLVAGQAGAHAGRWPAPCVHRRTCGQTQRRRGLYGSRPGGHHVGARGRSGRHLRHGANAPELGWPLSGRLGLGRRRARHVWVCNRRMRKRWPTNCAPLQPAATRNRVRDVTYTERTLQAVMQAEKLRSLGGAWSQKLVYGVDVSRANMDNLVTGVNGPAYEAYPLKPIPQHGGDHLGTVRAERIRQRPLESDSRLALRPRLARRRDQSAVPVAAGIVVEWRADAQAGCDLARGEAWSVFATLAAGFKSPNPLQLNNYFQNPLGNYETIPNPSLRPEKSRTFELGVRASPDRFDWGGRRVHGSLQGLHRRPGHGADHTEAAVPVGQPTVGDVARLRAQRLCAAHSEHHGAGRLRANRRHRHGAESTFELRQPRQAGAGAWISRWATGRSAPRWCTA